ncbi:hypothetical protein BDD43_5986 [Mucilaginibacter gracilis]|uniref:Lysylphosphatidylglycerol synthase-like protein n=1 Tax=Mucilaginibacter gracilis TaxID=423350 RepID=A0A495J9V8_9SPHI|nr:lysylphosphatidylglycerol synthase domain-containing protein [Mucilaginibacter gracilis]RKR85715.1 hypothetical protein BDD43_5986 [Mucilaginibacter gracilis]
MTSFNKKVLSYSIKVGIIALAYGFIYHTVTNNHKLIQFKLLIAHINQNQVLITFTAVILLMLVNWFLEALKWKYLISKLQHIGVFESVEAIFCGLTWAIFTPYRLGEFGGRVMFLPPRKRAYGVFVMGIGQFGQGTITNVVGAFALTWFLYTYMHLNAWVMFFIALVLTVFALVILTCYFNIKWFVTLLDRVSFLKKYARFFDIIARYSNKQLIITFLFCLARFSVFSFQYYLVIHLLLPALPAFPSMMMVFNNFFIQSALPTLDFIDVGLRGLTASTFFGYITNQQIAVLASVSSIWFVNLIIPAILGSVFVLKIKFFDRNS